MEKLTLEEAKRLNNTMVTEEHVNYPRLKSQACRKGIFPHYNLPGYSQLA